MNKCLIPLILILCSSVVAATPKTEAKQFSWTLGNDPEFDASVAQPAFSSGKGPSILIDTGHHNFLPYYQFLHPFAALAEADGYRVEFNNQTFSSDYLSSFDIVLIATALPFEFTTQLEVTDKPTFTNAEIDSVVDWVSAGGALLVFSEHAPFDQAIIPLLARFNIESSVGYTIDPENAEEDASAGWIVYSSDNELLNANHPIVAGRSAQERVDRVMTYGGSALTGPDYENVLALSASATNSEHPTGVGPVGHGNSQALAGEFGAGKVLAFGDSNGFSAMLFKQVDTVRAAGMSDPRYQWKQFVLNALHWLAE
ncbi:MAG: hypothetical protein DHS20C11_16090 [Lysobacteraceae bacterium]|nr:MAG: hypothetical protein DHS20C11_16090 [Xanthomonadaceae bacterium]